MKYTRRKYVPTRELDAVICDFYSEPAPPEGRIAALAEKLSWPQAAVWRRAKELGFTLKIRKSPLKYQSSPELDRKIRVCVRKPSFDCFQALSSLSAQCGWPKSALLRRAGELGLLRMRPNRLHRQEWNPAETQLLESMAHLEPKTIQKQMRLRGFVRTLHEIEKQIREMRLLENLDGYSTSQLASYMGVDVTAVHRWILSGKLKAEKTGHLETHGQPRYFIHYQNVRNFIQCCPEAFRLANVDQLWFLDLVFDGLGERQARGFKTGDLADRVL